MVVLVLVLGGMLSGWAGFLEASANLNRLQPSIVAGYGYTAIIPEDRRGLASCLDMNLLENFLLTTRQGFSKGPWLLREKAEVKARQLIEEFDVQPPNPMALARHLSGGNLQKMVLAREFYRRPRLIVAKQPTQGLDIGATEDIWQVLLKARTEAGILLITGDFNEALALSDRIIVLFGGRIMGTLDVEDIDQVEHIGLLMAGIIPEPTQPAAGLN